MYTMVITQAYNNEYSIIQTKFFINLLNIFYSF